MKTMRLRDGDLLVSRQDYMTVTGTGKIAQDLRGHLGEPIGNDRFHTAFGSTLHQFIGTLANEDTRSQIENEVNRVISNYAAVLRDKVEADITSENAPRFSTDEILSRIQDVKVDLRADSVQVEIRLQAASGEVVILTSAVNG